MESPSSASAGDGSAASTEEVVAFEEKKGQPNVLENGWYDYRFMKNGKPRPSAVRDFPEGIVPLHQIQRTDDGGCPSPTTLEGKYEQSQAKGKVGALATATVTETNAISAKGKDKEASEPRSGLNPVEALTYPSKKNKAALGEQKSSSLTSSDALKISNGNDMSMNKTQKTAEGRRNTLTTTKKKVTVTSSEVSKLDKKRDLTENVLEKSIKAVDGKNPSTVPDASADQETKTHLVKEKVTSTKDLQRTLTNTGQLPEENMIAVAPSPSDISNEEAEAASGKKEDASSQNGEVRRSKVETAVMVMTESAQTKVDMLMEEISVVVPSGLQEREQKEDVPHGKSEQTIDVEKHLEEKSEKTSLSVKKGLPLKRKSGVRDLPDLKGRKQEVSLPQAQVEAMDAQTLQEKEKGVRVAEQSKKTLPIKRKSGIRDMSEPLQSKNKGKKGVVDKQLAEDTEMEVLLIKSRETAEGLLTDMEKTNDSKKRKKPLEEPSSSEKSKKLPKLKPLTEAQTLAMSNEGEPNTKSKEQVATPKPTKKLPSTPSGSVKKPTPSDSSKKGRRSAGKSVRPVASITDPNEARKLVLESLRLYDAVRRKLVQDEEKHGKQGRGSRADLQAASLLKDQNASRVVERVVGSLPGVLVGDIFLFRTELSFARVHGPIQGGIEYLTTKDSEYNIPVAISIISNVGQDGDDNGDELIYTGQGGRSVDNKQIAAQTLVRGNLAMEGSRKLKLPVRVLRGIKDVNSPTGKVYVYDGLYSVEDTYTQKGSGGFDEYKFRLQRLPAQPALGLDALKLAADLKGQPLSSRKSVVVPDLSKGKEKQAVSVENAIDDDKPAEFKYSTTVSYPDELGQLEAAIGCRCHGACTPSSSCSCFSRNGDEFPHLNGGYLVRQKDYVFECGSKCSCSSSCRNRAMEQGPKFRLDVFKTDKMGWAVRSLETIPAGSFVCEYIGRVVANEQDARELGDRKYMLFTRWLTESTPRWGDVPSIIPDRSSSSIRPDAEKPELVIDATEVGNVARFINHSCSPNLLVQKVLSGHHDLRYPQFKLFALDNIPPLRELTFDYGQPPEEEPKTEAIACLCGSSDCRGNLYL